MMPCESNISFDNFPAEIILKFLIVLTVIALAAVTVWFTPLPNANPESCERKCHELDWPMICRIQLTLESTVILTKKCENCSLYPDVCRQNGCMDDFSHFRNNKHARRVLMANKQIAAASPIQACVNDIMMVDVRNRIAGQSVAVHWRGQRQRESPTMDGVSMVTQCPIASHTVFQYKFRATDPGTHLWHLHSSSGEGDNLYGMFVVRESRRKDPFSDLYDFDIPTHYYLISEQMTTGSLLINGQLSNDNQAAIVIRRAVQMNRRYRFRIAYAAGGLNCPVDGSVVQHSMLVIALDGNPIIPVYTEKFTIAPGERLDFILRANQKFGNYRMRFEKTGHCAHTTTTGEHSVDIYSAEVIISYNATDSDIKNKQLPENQSNDNNFQSVKLISTVDVADCSEKTGVKGIGCIGGGQLQNFYRMPEVLAGEQVDKVIYLAYHYSFVQTNRYHHPAPASLNDDGGGGDNNIRLVACMNNISFVYPSSPLTISSDVNDNLSSSEAVAAAAAAAAANVLCDETRRPDQCSAAASGTDAEQLVCECVHVIRIPLHATVELILSHHGELDDRDHVFHMHGYKLYIVSRTKYDHRMSPSEIRRLNSKGLLLSRNLQDPILKDTVSVPSHAVLAVRFKANNPGYWLLQESTNSKILHGMQVVLQVGEKTDLQELPKDFPKCGNFVGPKFFLA